MEVMGVSIALLYRSSPGPKYFQGCSPMLKVLLMCRVEVGRSLAKMGMKAEALEELNAAVQLPVEDINAYLQKEDALLLIKDLQRSLPRKRPSDALGVDSGMPSGDGILRPAWQLRLPRELALPHWQLPQLPFLPQNGPAPTAA